MQTLACDASRSLSAAVQHHLVRMIRSGPAGCPGHPSQFHVEPETANVQPSQLQVKHSNHGGKNIHMRIKQRNEQVKRNSYFSVDSNGTAHACPQWSP
jgi:hypothetical protein